MESIFSSRNKLNSRQNMHSNNFRRRQEFSLANGNGYLVMSTRIYICSKIIGDDRKHSVYKIL